jgi:hypothetical protein
VSCCPVGPLDRVRGNGDRPRIDDTFGVGGLVRRIPEPRSDAALLAEATVEASPSAPQAFGAVVAAAD